MFGAVHSAAARPPTAPGRPESSRPGAPASEVGGLTPEEQAAVAELQRTDREVRAHEQAHLAAAGGLAGGVTFTYATGPDGRQYAVGGEVSIDTSPVEGDPQATIQKARQIRVAANAPANPSGQDRAVAAAAASMEAAARAELAQERGRDLAGRYESSETAQPTLDVRA